MHRRTLIMRRFGVLSFGLGYIEDGVWVDHAVATAQGEGMLANASDAERATIGAIHAWFTCCEGAPIPNADAGESRSLVVIAGPASS